MTDDVETFDKYNTIPYEMIIAESPCPRKPAQYFIFLNRLNEKATADRVSFMINPC